MVRRFVYMVSGAYQKYVGGAVCLCECGIIAGKDIVGLAHELQVRSAMVV